MKPRLNATGVVLIFIVGLGALAGFDVVRGQRSSPAAIAPDPSPAADASASAPTFDPGFRAGETAPDFTLPDRFGKEQRLSKMVTGDTLLFTTCGCAHCLDLQNYVGILLRKMGRRAPKVINLTTMPKDRELTWIRDTHLPQTVVYEEKGGPVTGIYRGHPCPRVFRLEPGLKVAWIGPSIKDVKSLEGVGDAVAANLGFSRDQGHAIAPTILEQQTPPKKPQ